MYTADEGIGSVEVCLVVRRDITLQDPLLEIILTTSPGEAQGIHTYKNAQCHHNYIGCVAGKR